MKRFLQDAVQEAAQRAWSDARAVIVGVEEDVARRVRQVRDRVDPRQGAEELQRLLGEVGARLQQNSEALERRLEESIRLVTARLWAPLQQEVAALRERVERVSQRAEARFGGREQDSEPPRDDAAGGGTGSAGGEEGSHGR